MLRKLFGKAKVGKEINKSENHLISGPLMNGWKEQEDNGMISGRL